MEDYNVNRQNGVLREVLASRKYPHVQRLPFYALTRPRWRWHFGNCTARPNGWGGERCCDCTYCLAEYVGRAFARSEEDAEPVEALRGGVS